MSNADAVRAANPNAYAAGEIGAETLSLAMAGTGIYKAGVRQFGDDAIKMIGGKDQFQRIGEKTLKEYSEWLRDELIEMEMGNTADQNYCNSGNR